MVATKDVLISFLDNMAACLMETLTQFQKMKSATKVMILN